MICVLGEVILLSRWGKGNSMETGWSVWTLSMAQRWTLGSKTLLCFCYEYGMYHLGIGQARKIMYTAIAVSSMGFRGCWAGATWGVNMASPFCYQQCTKLYNMLGSHDLCLLTFVICHTAGSRCPLPSEWLPHFFLIAFGDLV